MRATPRTYRKAAISDMRKPPTLSPRWAARLPRMNSKVKRDACDNQVQELVNCLCDAGFKEGSCKAAFEAYWNCKARMVRHASHRKYIHG